MKSVLISIQPKWVEKIAKGEKTIEVRKSKPKIETPFKCYIYYTKKKHLLAIFRKGDYIFSDDHKAGKFDENIFVKGDYYWSGKVIGEFVCDKVYDLKYVPTVYYGKPAGTYEEMICNSSCLSVDQIKEYAKGRDIYGWHISDLKIYDKPKELSEFKHWVNDKDYDGWNEQGTKIVKGFVLRPLTRPFQSWGYIEV